MLKVTQKKTVFTKTISPDFITAGTEAFVGSRQYYEAPNKIRLTVNNIKIDLFQFEQAPVGSFKLRGAVNAVRKLAESCGEKLTVVCASSGNFGVGVAHAAKIFSLKSKIFVPLGIPEEKLNKIKAMEAIVIEGHPSYEDAKAAAKYCGEAQGHHFIDGVDDDVIAGNASIILEVMDMIDLANGCVVLPLGLGSLAFPVARVLMESNVPCDLILCESIQYAKLCLKLGANVSLVFGDTIADGVKIAELPAKTESLVKKSVASCYAFTDSEILEVMRYLWSAHHVKSEGASACSLGPMFFDPEAFRSYEKCVVIGTGNNVDLTKVL